MIPDAIYRLFALVFFTTIQAKEWPDPAKDELIFIANPIEANMPGHWVPGSIVKAILEGKGPYTTTTTKKRTIASTKKPTETPKKMTPEPSIEQQLGSDEPVPETASPEKETDPAPEPATEPELEPETEAPADPPVEPETEPPTEAPTEPPTEPPSTRRTKPSRKPVDGHDDTPLKKM
ncbi:uncharacterized protein LOC142977682 isoform X2 [Anticarsia gemmatalis]|uniref:uncharacterized protein LOC142977682 isoform X2 n=1 Tax=Anticarsia gemmatalis TaxID=129554 RepID=UPI003F7727AD